METGAAVVTVEQVPSIVGGGGKRIAADELEEERNKPVVVGSSLAALPRVAETPDGDFRVSLAGRLTAIAWRWLSMSCAVVAFALLSTTRPRADTYR